MPTATARGGGWRILREIGKYIAIFRTELRQMTTYAWDFVLSNITIVLFFYVLIQVWKITIDPSGPVDIPGENFTWGELIWFLAGGQILYFSVHTEVQLDIQNDVISGNIVITLARPYDYLLARFSRVVAHTLMSFFVAFPAAFLVAWWASGEILVTPLGIAFFLVGFLLRSLLYFALQAIAGLATFWVERATGLVWLTGLLILIFGGGAVPLGAWGEPARTIVELTPFPVMMYYPAKLLVRPDAATVTAALLRSGVWIVLLGGIVSFIYGRALRRLDINGG